MANHRQTVEELFEEALVRSGEERRRFLDGACADAPELRRLVEELLEADEQAGSFLQTPIITPSREKTDETVSTLSSDRRSGEKGHPSSVLLQLGTVVAGRFTINRFIARGGMGEVYEAWDPELRERVALKTVRPDLGASPEVLERFRREVKQARAISHPNICRVHELFCHEVNGQSKVWFLTMELLEGVTLSDHIRHEGPLKPPAAYALVEQMVDGLSAAHRLGVIHRDFKTGNVMLVSAGPGRLRAVITDFGLALNVLRPDGGLAEPGGQGTPAFMAPEQRSTGNVTALADQYALGVVMCEMLTGSRPTRRTNSGEDTSIAVKLPDEKIPPRWRRVIGRCLQSRPEDRFKSVEEISPALSGVRHTWQMWAWPATAVVAAALLAISHPFKPHAQPTSLAVLPLENDTGDVGLEYLAEGVSEALTDDLSRMPGLAVTAGSVARRYRGQNVDPRSAGRTLQVRSVVSGSIANPNGKLRIPIELVDTETGRQVWGQTYEGSLSQVPELQHEISADVAYRLKIRLDPDTKARLTRQYSTNSLTYDAYLKGRYHLAQRSPDALQQAIIDFQRALDHDPQYAPAYAGLADSYSMLGFYGLENPAASFSKAMAAAQQALELDSTLGEAYTSRALARSFLNFDWERAEEDYKRAIELNPRYIPAHTWYGLLLLTPLGRRAEAAAQLGYTQSLDPDSLVTTFSLATMDYLSGNEGRSIALCEARMGMLREFEPALQVLADDYLAQGMDRRALNLLETKGTSDGTLRERAVELGIAYARTGQRAKALTELSIAEESLRQGTFLYYRTAELYTALGNYPKALDLLEEGYAKRESNLVFLSVDPLFAPLRSEPRYLRLIKLMNLS